MAMTMIDVMEVLPMTNVPAPNPLRDRLAHLAKILWRFEARPYLGTSDDVTWTCVAHDLDGKLRVDLPTSGGEPSPLDAVELLIEAFEQALPWEPWYVPPTEENSAALVAADAERADESGPRTLADGVPTAYVSPDGPAFTVQLEVGLMRAEVA